jgi:hypothetical protein
MTEFLAFWVTRRRGDAAPESWLGGSSTIYFTNVRVALAFLRGADNARRKDRKWIRVVDFSVDNGIHLVVEIQQNQTEDMAVLTAPDDEYREKATCH